MKIAVIGGGGVGGYIAAKLSEVADVDLISKSLHQLKIIENNQEKIYHPNIVRSPTSKLYDIVIFATKSYVLEKHAKELEKNVNENTIILPLLNGIKPYYILKEIFKNSKVIKGAIYIISNKISTDTIKVKGKGALVVFEDINDKTKKLKELFEKAGIKVKTPKDIDKAIWQKYLFIAATAALTTYYKKTFGEIAKEHLDEFEKILDEIIDIAKQNGINLDKEDKEKAILLLIKSPKDAKSSMQLDFEKNQKSEIDNILGFLATNKDTLIYRIYKKLKSN
ncbi:ketopantoate reductase family protein [Nitrosophilus kaiyonis]|uniref:ketopantoate reductase family protein n=1 Tax=Nitrosophilus kaiyonis TaxID=2930200 RepID=UPI0024938871|nr:2-dehydropantoate 2-reductase [Nitrosophilus kaiyonis]